MSFTIFEIINYFMKGDIRCLNITNFCNYARTAKPNVLSVVHGVKGLKHLMAKLFVVIATVNTGNLFKSLMFFHQAFLILAIKNAHRHIQI